MSRVRKWAIVALGALVGGCTPEAPLPRAPGSVTITMDEFRFVAPDSFPAGRVVLRTRNAGELKHDLVVIEIAEELPPLGEQLQSETRHATPTLAVLPTQKAGEEAAFALDLEPGRYGMVCFVPDDEGVPHALRGMHAEFTVD
ncbi:MAG TPA: hypothetical protein VM784_02005 [Actinomycetota bacterium]|nr:hypothetical protein [Actinomycetota bacterium]